MARFLGITWTTKEAEGCSDFIPFDWVNGKAQTLKGQVHSYASKRGTLYPLKCDVIARTEETTLDYTPYGTFDANKFWDPYVLFVEIRGRAALPVVVHSRQLNGRRSKAGVGLIEWIDDLDYFFFVAEIKCERPEK